jgi:hypothetical protein
MRRILAVALLALAAGTGLPATAHAGGPTSVLVTQPGVSAAGLYYTDEAYDELLGLLPTGETRGKELPPGGGVAYSLTWMVHDVMPWRFDRVSVHGDGTAWVATTFSADATTRWQPVGEGTELFDLLTAVLADGGASGPVSETMAASAPATSATETRTVTETEWFSLSGWRWVVPGAVLGLLVGVAAARVRRTRADEPRQVLVDA